MNIEFGLLKRVTKSKRLLLGTRPDDAAWNVKSCVVTKRSEAVLDGAVIIIIEVT